MSIKVMKTNQERNKKDKFPKKLKSQVIINRDKTRFFQLN